MAKYYSSTFGKISGKHGNAVAVIRKDGSTYLRLHKKSSNPRTDKQQAHRAKFALSSKALVPFNPIFKMTMGPTNGISTARSHAFKNAIVGEYPSFYMDYEKLMFSFGPLAKLEKPSASIDEGVVSLNWGFDKMYNSHASDSVCLVVFNKDANQSIHIDDVAIRSDKECKINIHDSWAESDLYVWAYLKNGDKFSDSVYVDEYDEHNDVELVDNEREKSEVDTSEQNINSTHIYSQILCTANKVIMSFFIMFYNLFVLSNRVFIESKIQNIVPDLKCIVSSIENIMITTVCEKTYRIDVKSIRNSIRRSVFEVLLPRSQSIYVATPIPVMN